MPRVLKEWLACCLVGTLLCCVICVAMHLPGWCRGLDHWLDQQQRAAGYQVAAEDAAARAADTLSLHLPLTLQAVQQGSAQLPATMMAIRKSAEMSIQSSDELLDTLGSTNAMIGDIKRQADDILPKAGDTLVKLGGTADAASATIIQLGTASEAVTGFINRPALDQAIKNVSLLAGNSAQATHDFDVKFLAPYTGLHPKLHTAITIGRGILGLSEPAYYTKGVLQ